MDIADEFQEMARDSDSFIEWFNFLNEYRIKIKEQMKTTDHTRDAVVLATMHGAKGLEFDQVFAVFPQKDRSPLVRQARYIAATRALHELHMYEVEK